MNINSDNLFLFIQNKENEQVMEYLSGGRIDIKDEYGRTPLINAAFYNNVELIDWLVRSGAHINAADNIGFTALHFAAQEANTESLKLLIEHGADLNRKDIYGNTPAWVAVMNWKAGKNFDNLKALVNSGADLSLKNNAGRSAAEIIPAKIMSDIKA
jgi:ankyrin repeat protein